jgi:membrane-bound serine protease (ClpP class)
MRSVISGRRFRWLLGALLVVTGITLHQSTAHAQDAARPGAPVEERRSIDLGAAASDALVSRDAEDTGVQGAPALGSRSDLAGRVSEFVATPAVAVILIAAGVLLLLADLFTAGFGVAGILGLGLLALFFWGHAHAGLAGWESVALVALGVVLLALEVFVIPGFGVAGVTGLAALLGGLFLALLGDEHVTREAMVRAGSTVGVSVITIVAGGVALLWLLPQLPWLRGLVLQTNLPLPETAGGRDLLILGAALDRDAEDAWMRGVAPEPPSLRGAAGVALSDLRPSGFARIGGERVDVVSHGEYIPAGTPLEVIADEGYRRVVRRVAEHNAGMPDADASGVRSAARVMGQEDEPWMQRT